MTQRSGRGSNSPRGHPHSLNNVLERSELQPPVKDQISSASHRAPPTGPIECRGWKAQANRRIAQCPGIENEPIRARAVSGPTAGLVRPRPGPRRLQWAEGIGATGARPAGEQGASVWRSGRGDSPWGCAQALLCSQTRTDVPSPRGSSCLYRARSQGTPSEGVCGTEMAGRPRKPLITPRLTGNRPNQPFLERCSWHAWRARGPC